MGYVYLRPGLGRQYEGRRGRRILRARRRARYPRKGRSRAVVDDAGRQGVVFAVQDHWQPRCTGVEHAVPEHPGGGRAEAVVRNTERPGLLQQAHLGEPLASEPDVQCGGDVSPYPRLLLYPAREAADDDWLVHYGIGVRHHHNARETTGGSGSGTALYGLLVLAPRCAPVGVYVHETGEQVQAVGVEFVSAA